MTFGNPTLSVPFVRQTRLKILHIGDVHLRDGEPESRRPGFKEQLQAKLREAIDIANRLAVDYVVLAGDVFHHKNPRNTSHALMFQAMEILAASKAPIYTVVGNHDLSDDNPQSLPRQPLGVLIKSGVIRKVPYLRHEGIWIGFRHYHADYNVPATYSLGPGETGNYTILFTHGDFLPNDYRFMGKCVRYEEFLFLPDLLVNGHIHDDVGDFILGRHRIVNNGALVRGTKHEYNLKRKVKVTFIHVYEEDGTVKGDCRALAIKSALPAEEVFLPEKMLAVSEDQLAKFAEQLKEEAESQPLAMGSLKQKLLEVARDQGLGEEVVGVAARYLETYLD